MKKYWLWLVLSVITLAASSARAQGTVDVMKEKLMLQEYDFLFADLEEDGAVYRDMEKHIKTMRTIDKEKTPTKQIKDLYADALKLAKAVNKTNFESVKPYLDPEDDLNKIDLLNDIGLDVKTGADGPLELTVYDFSELFENVEEKEVESWRKYNELMFK